MIIESAHIATVLEHSKTTPTRSCLIIFDVDNVLVEPCGWVGGTPWFEYELNKRIEQGVDSKQAFEQVLALCVQFQHAIELKLVDPQTAEIVKALQAQGHCVIALTSRAPAQAERTIAQLKKLGIDFSISCFNAQAIDKPYSFQSGIIFCQTYAKSQAVIELLEDAHYLPETILFIDDFLKNVQALHVALKDWNPAISYIGIRYSYLDGKRVDVSAAQQELENLQKQTASTL